MAINRSDVLTSAIAVLDEAGLPDLTMRRVAADLGVADPLAQASVGRSDQWLVLVEVADGGAGLGLRGGRLGSGGGPRQAEHRELPLHGERGGPHQGHGLRRRDLGAARHVEHPDRRAGHRIVDRDGRAVPPVRAPGESVTRAAARAAGWRRWLRASSLWISWW